MCGISRASWWFSWNNENRCVAVSIVIKQVAIERHNLVRVGELHMKVVRTDNAPAAIGPYSQGIVVNGMLFASGQIALDPQSGEMVGTTIQEQSEQVMKNVTGLLKAAGTDLDHVVKTTCFLADINDFVAFNEVYARFFDKNLPARSAVGVAALPKGALVEVEVVAVVE